VVGRAANIAQDQRSPSSPFCQAEANFSTRFQWDESANLHPLAVHSACYVERVLSSTSRLTKGVSYP